MLVTAYRHLQAFEKLALGKLFVKLAKPNSKEYPYQRCLLMAMYKDFWRYPFELFEEVEEVSLICKNKLMGNLGDRRIDFLHMAAALSNRRFRTY